MSASYSFRKVYGSSSILAALTLVGLLLALFGDGIWDALSWGALAVPLFVLISKIANGSKQTRARQ